MSIQEVNLKSTFKDLFNRVATNFDTFGVKTFSYFGERLVENMGIGKGANVLDIASGKGASLFPAAARAGLAGHVTGIDIAEEMVNRASDQAKAHGFKNVRVLQMDAENLDFPDEYFDNALCGFGIFFMPNYKTALCEFRRVLKTNGKLGLTTFLKKDYEEYGWLNVLAQKYFPSEEDSKATYQLTGPVFDTVEGMANILVEGGFREINVFSEEKEFIMKDAEEWWNRRWSQGSRLHLEKLSSDLLEQYKEEAFNKLNDMKKKDGIHFKQSVLFSFGVK